MERDYSCVSQLQSKKKHVWSKGINAYNVSYKYAYHKLFQRKWQLGVNDGNLENPIVCGK